MTENLNYNLKSLLTKLSAVRVTLTDEEQSLLDQLILSSKAEVHAHYRKFASDEGKAMEADEARAASLNFKPDEGKAMEADEARAASLNFKPDEGKVSGSEAAYANRLLKPVEGKALDTDEVAAHSIPPNMLTNPVWVKIIYDPEMECYKVI